MARINPSTNVILRKDKTKMDLAAYHHVSLSSPVHSTLDAAINNKQPTSWPRLTRDLIVKKLPPILATAKGHLRQEKQNLQFTKTEDTYADELKILNQI